MSVANAIAAKNTAITFFENGDYDSARKKIQVAQMELMGIKRVGKNQQASGEVELDHEALNAILVQIDNAERRDSDASTKIQTATVEYTRVGACEAVE